MITPDYTLRQFELGFELGPSVVAYPSVGSPWITDTPTPGKALTVRQAWVLFRARAENDISVCFKNPEGYSKGTVLVKRTGTQNWVTPGATGSLEQFVSMLDLCHIHVV